MRKTTYLKIAGILAMTVLAIPFSGFFLSSCTKIDAPYVTVKSTKIIDTVMNWDTVTPVRKVLLEEYTGHLCTNCPEAGIVAHDLENTYSGRLVVMAVHAGYFATPQPSGDYAADYRCHASETWNTDLGVGGSFPAGIVNRKVFNGSMVLGKDQWSSCINQVINTAPDAFIVMTKNYNSGNGTLTANIYNKFLNPLTGTYRLILCVVEDSLHSSQKNNNKDIGPTPDWPNYNFMHVNRNAINGDWGDVLTTSVNTGHTYIDRITYKMSSAWVAKNCWLYAILFKESTREIVQVSRIRIG